MSIIALAVRLATVQALKNKSFAGDNVFDSAIAPLEMKVKERPLPFIVVYTDEEVSTLKGSDFFDTTRDLTLTIHMAVATQVSTEEAGQTISIPPTDEGLEITLDLLAYDVLAALQAGQDSWCELWRRLVLDKKSFHQRRGAADDKGVRFAAREIVLHLDVMDEPVPGGGETDISQALEQAFRSKQALSFVADLIHARVVKGNDWPQWDKARAELGLDGASADAVGIGPTWPLPGRSN